MIDEMNEQDQKAFEAWCKGRSEAGRNTPSFATVWEAALAYDRQPPVLKRMEPPDEPGVWAYAFGAGGVIYINSFAQRTSGYKCRWTGEEMSAATHWAYLGPIPTIEEEKTIALDLTPNEEAALRGQALWDGGRTLKRAQEKLREAYVNGKLREVE